MTSNLTRCLFCSKISEYQCFDVCYPETSYCVSKPLLLQCEHVISQCLCQVSLGLNEILIGANDFKLKLPLIRSKICENQLVEACCPKTSSDSSKPLYLRCKLVIFQCLCQFSLGLKEVQKGPFV